MTTLNRYSCFAVLAFFGTALISTAIHAQAAPTGVWKGTVGKAAVMVCFSDTADSHYYYLRHLRGITLIPSTAPGKPGTSSEAATTSMPTGTFALEENAPDAAVKGEDATSGHWLLQAQSPTEITGSWMGPQGGKPLPIALHKLQASTPTGIFNCGQAFYEPLHKGMRLTYRPATFKGHEYRIVASQQAAALEMPADLPSAQAFNRFVLEWLKEQETFAYDCKLGLRRTWGGPIALGRELKPKRWTNDYLVLEDTLPETYCGGAHGSWSISYLTWSWPQGRMVNTWTWLQGGSKSLEKHTNRQGEPIQSDLFRLIAKRHPRNQKDDECRDVLDTMDIEPPYPTAAGLVFNTSFPHVMRACGDTVSVSWKQLWPYLSADGRAVAKQFSE